MSDGPSAWAANIRQKLLEQLRRFECPVRVSLREAEGRPMWGPYYTDWLSLQNPD